MIRRIWQAYTMEVVKALRVRQTYVGPAVAAALIALAPLIHPLGLDASSDYGFIAYVTPLALNSLGFLLMLAYCSGLVSTELGNGSIRLTLIRPIHRHEYLLAKVLLGFTYALVLTVLVGAVSWGMTYAFGELTGVTFGGELVYTGEEMAQAYFTGMLLSLAPLCAGAAYAVFLSACTRSPVLAMSLSVGFWIVVDLVKHPLGIAPFVFTTHLETPWQVFIKRCDAIDAAWFPDVWYCLGSSGAVAAVCVGLAVAVLHYRNLSA